MPHLKLVYPYPAKGRADRQEGDEVADCTLRALRSVCELYSESLAGAELESRTTELRIFSGHSRDIRDVQCSVHVDPSREGPETAWIHAPTSMLRLTPRVRAEVLLGAVHGVVGRLAVARGWDPTRLERCRQHALEHDLEFRWDSAPKTSPDRRFAARARFRLLPDGYGRVRLEVSDRVSGRVAAISEEGVAFCTLPGFKRAAASLRWRGSTEVDVVPYDFVPAVRGGRVRLQRDGDRWASLVEDYVRPLSVPEGDADESPPLVVVEGSGVTAPEQPPEAVFIGGGPMSHRVEAFDDAFTRDMRRLCGEEGQRWWADAGLRALEIMISYDVPRAAVRTRLSSQRLAVFVDQPDPQPGDRVDQVARQQAEAVVSAVRRRTGLGPHPAFPDVRS